MDKKSKLKLKIPRKEATQILYKKVRQLRQLGWDWDEIANLLKISKRTVSRALDSRRSSTRQDLHPNHTSR